MIEHLTILVNKFTSPTINGMIRWNSIHEMAFFAQSQDTFNSTNVYI